jgi:hypothetical protein
MADTQRVTAKEAQEKAAECRDMARRTTNPEHRVMLEQMADAWERIAGDR